MTAKSEIGLIGLGVMGKSLAINMAGKGFQLSVYNRHVPDIEELVAEKFISGDPNLSHLKGFDNINEFLDSLEKPRNILLMVNAGKAVDEIIAELLPHLQPEDVIIDGGNSHYQDTMRRTIALHAEGIYLLGTGISGGEEGAIKGPSIMPGGDTLAYDRVGRYLEEIAAKDKQGLPCCTYIGPTGAGHFVKMVHNGIEYAEMQLITELYHLLRYYALVEPEEIANIFESWGKQGFSSYILEITIAILRRREGGELLLDKILDAAKQKNTGGWTAEAAFRLGVPLNTISEAVMARLISSKKAERVQAMDLYGKLGEADRKRATDEFSKKLLSTYINAGIINHAIGFDLLKEASGQYDWKLNLSEIARIWTNGCIIRSDLMESLVDLLKNEDPLLQQPVIVEKVKGNLEDFTGIVAEGLRSKHPLPVLSAALNYFLSYTSGDLPANLIQAQRDYFGAHTYQRKDKPPEEHFHTAWTEPQ